MSGRRQPQLIEWCFVAALLGVCVVLTALQSRWTNDLGRATFHQQSTQLRSRAQLLCRTFDAELNEACAQLCPSGEQIATLGREGAHAESLRRWQAGKPRPLFRRLAVAVPEGGEAQLYLLDQQIARLARAEWPPEWRDLRDNLSAHAAGRPMSPFVETTGYLREYPVFGGAPGRPGRPGETEWIITELAPDYVRQTWLPELIRTHLNSGQMASNEVLVQTRIAAPETVFSTTRETPPAQDDLVSLAFNSKPRGGRMTEDADAEAFWTLRTWPRSGEFAAAVSSARRRDFTLACVLDGCLLVGGLVVIYYARRARQVGDARLQFVTAVSHELRTPLTVIRAAGQNLRRGIVRDPARIEKYAELILEHSDRLADMVEQVLAFAGAKHNRLTLARTPVSVSALLREAVATCASVTQAAGCEVQLDVGENLPPVLGDAQALRQVFQNLVSNAAKHGAEGRWIGVQTRYRNGRSPGCVEVAVSDRGVGIPPQDQPHLFEPFFRGSQACARQTRGSGIGLSVVQEIVRVHQGSVRVESRAGGGTIFTVSLPVLPPGEASSPAAS